MQGTRLRGRRRQFRHRYRRRRIVPRGVQMRKRIMRYYAVNPLGRYISDLIRKYGGVYSKYFNLKNKLFLLKPDDAKIRKLKLEVTPDKSLLARTGHYLRSNKALGRSLSDSDFDAKLIVPETVSTEVKV